MKIDLKVGSAKNSISSIIEEIKLCVSHCRRNKIIGREKKKLHSNEIAFVKLFVELFFYNIKIIIYYVVQFSFFDDNNILLTYRSHLNNFGAIIGRS